MQVCNLSEYHNHSLKLAENEPYCTFKGWGTRKKQGPVGVLRECIFLSSVRDACQQSHFVRLVEVLSSREVPREPFQHYRAPFSLSCIDHW